MKHVPGDLISLAQQGRFDVIVHGCNCFCTLGAGIARVIRQAFPAAYQADLRTEKGDRAKLGTCSSVECEIPNGVVTVVNAYTQFHWRGRGVKADYDAIRSCFVWLRGACSGSRLGIPRLGAGLAGGDWRRISQIILDALPDEDITVVELPPRRK